MTVSAEERQLAPAAAEQPAEEAPASASKAAAAAAPQGVPVAPAVPAPPPEVPAGAVKRTYTSVSYVPNRSHASHPWHDLETGENPPDLINAGEQGREKAAPHPPAAVCGGCWCRRASSAGGAMSHPPPPPILCPFSPVIEIPRGSKVKYELDKKTGALAGTRKACGGPRCRAGVGG